MTIFTLFASILVPFTIVFLFILISTDNWVFLVFFHVMTFFVFICLLVESYETINIAL